MKPYLASAFLVFSLFGFFLSLPSPSFFQGVRACGSKESKEGLLYVREQKGNRYLIYLFICCVSSPCVNISCIFMWWCSQTGACPDLCYFSALHALLRQEVPQTLLVALLFLAKDKSFVRDFIHREEQGWAGGGMNHSTLCNALSLWTDLAVDTKQYFFKWKINPLVL